MSPVLLIPLWLPPPLAEGRAQWGRLLLLTFLGETRKVSHPPGRIPGSGLTLSSAMPSSEPTNLGGPNLLHGRP